MAGRARLADRARYRTAYATNTVFRSDIVNGEVRSADLQDNGVAGIDVEESSLQAARVMLRSRTKRHQDCHLPDWRPYPLDDATWTQPADALNDFAGEWVAAPAPGCSRNSTINARVLLDGKLYAGSDAVILKPDDPPHTENFAPSNALTLFEPGAPIAHTLSAETIGVCGTEADPGGSPPRIRAVRIDVIETR